jgi:proteasome lid subunit RPN8/RPN11
MTMKLRLPEHLRAQIMAQARAAYPGECCGLLLGHAREATSDVVALYPARNLEMRNDRFEIAPEDHFAALKRARAEGLGVIGCYHSHPDGVARPSATDLAGAGEQGFIWLIAADDALAAFVYSGDSFEDAELVTSSS